MKRRKCTNALFKYFLTAVVGSQTLAHVSAQYVGLTVNDSTGSVGDINDPIYASTRGIHGKAETSDLYIGDINADITVGSASSYNFSVGIKIDWGMTPYGVHLENIAADVLLDVQSQRNATGMDLGEFTTVDHILGTIRVVGTEQSASGIIAQKTGGAPDANGIETIGGRIDVDSTSGYAQGVKLHSQVQVGLVNSEITVDSVTGGATGFDVDHQSHIDEFSATLSVSSVSGNATGLMVEGSSTIGAESGLGIGGTVTVRSESGIATGLYLSSQEETGISGDITVSSNKEAVGIQMVNDGQLGTISESATISVTLNKNADGTANEGNAYGIKAIDTIGTDAGYDISKIEGDFYVTNHTSSDNVEFGNAYGIYMEGDGNLGAIASDQVHESTSVISVSSADKDKAYGVYSETSKTLYFESGAQLTATTGIGDQKDHGYAIYNETHGITVAEAETSEGGNAFLNGNLHAGDKDIVFESGDFKINSDTWTSSGLQLGAGGSAGMTTSTVTVSAEDMVTSTATSLDFYLNSVTDYSQLLVETGGSLNFTNITEVNFHFSDEFIAAWGETYFGKIYLGEGIFEGLDMNSLAVNMYGDGLAPTIYTVDGNEISIELVDNGQGQIPEPSTATLSLIALAALMSRRRRRRA